MNREQFKLKQRLVYCEQVNIGDHAGRRLCPLPPYMVLLTKNDGAASEQNLPRPASTSKRERGNNNLDS